MCVTKATFSRIFGGIQEPPGVTVIARCQLYPHLINLINNSSKFSQANAEPFQHPIVEQISCQACWIQD